MILQNFSHFLEPQNISELYSLAAKWGNRAKVIAGGTDLLVRMKQRTCQPEALLSLKKVKELEDIVSLENGLFIGSAARLSDLSSSVQILEDYPLLAEAVAKVGAYQHRSMGTIGGNLCLETRCMYFNQSDFLRKSISPCLKAGGSSCLTQKGNKCYAVYSGDTAPALMALEAQVRIGSLSGERWEELSSLFTGDGLTPISLKEGEVIIGIYISKKVRSAGGAYLKLSERSSTNFPSLGIAASIILSDKDVCRQVRLAITAAGSRPFLVEEVGTLVGAKHLSDDLLGPILAATNKSTIMVKNMTTNLGYRRAMVKKLTRIVLETAWEKAKGRKGNYDHG